MPISIQREGEMCDRIAWFDGVLDWRILDRAGPESVCLRFIDPYGDMVVNQIQLPVLIGELEQIRAAASEPDLIDHIGELIGFLRGSEAVHVYVRFIGD